MKLRRSLKNLLLIPVLILTGLSACKHNDLDVAKPNENFRPAADFIHNNYDLSLFSAAIEKAGMAEQLNGAGPFTILAPNNNAFNILGINRPSDFDKMNPDSLKALVQRHILDRRILVQDIPVNGIDIRYRTLAGTEVYASIGSYNPGAANGTWTNMLYMNGAYASKKDVNLTNGILHVLERVMKYTPKSTVQSWLDKHPKYSLFVSALKKFGLWDQLAAEGPFTVFAPNNQAFIEAGLDASAIAALEPGRYIGARLFGSYILPKKHFFLSDFAVIGFINNDGEYVTDIANDTWFLSVNGGRSMFNGEMSYSMQTRTAREYPYDVGPWITSNSQAELDNLVDNGLVHDNQHLLVLPSQALKNQ